MATQALVAGDPPIVNIGTVVQAGLQGHDVVLIASSENTYNYSIVARPGTTRIEQLKGKRLGVSGFGSASHNAALILLKRFNLEPNKDVSLVVAGPTSERLSAVDAGRIDVTLLTPSELPRSRKQGLVEVYDMTDLGVEVQPNAFPTSRPDIRSPPFALTSAGFRPISPCVIPSASSARMIRRFATLPRCRGIFCAVLLNVSSSSRITLPPSVADRWTMLRNCRCSLGWSCEKRSNTSAAVGVFFLATVHPLPQQPLADVLGHGL